MKLKNESYEVTVTIDSTYTLDSADNSISYDREYNPRNYKKSDLYSTFCIRNLHNGIESLTALTGSHYCYDMNCAVLDNNVLTVLQNDFITKIDLDTNGIISTQEIPESIINYSIHRIPGGLVICGEMEILGLDQNCNVIWRKGSKDIITDFKILENSIVYHDDSGTDHRIDFDGSDIEQ